MAALVIIRIRSDYTQPSLSDTPCDCVAYNHPTGSNAEVREETFTECARAALTQVLDRRAFVHCQEPESEGHAQSEFTRNAAGDDYVRTPPPCVRHVVCSYSAHLILPAGRGVYIDTHPSSL